MPQFATTKASRYVPDSIKVSHNDTIMLHGMFLLDGIKRFRPLSADTLTELELGFTYPSKRLEKKTMPTISKRTYGEGRGRASESVDFPTLVDFLTPDNVSAIRQSSRYVELTFGDDWTTESGKPRYSTAKNALLETLSDLLDIDPEDDENPEVISLSDTLKKKNVLQFTIRQRPQ